MKKILVLMSAFNGEKFLREQLNSILNQELVETYLLIRNDGSTDSTSEILEEYKRVYGERVTYFSGKNIGFNKSFMELVYQAADAGEFDYYGFSDQDDVWDPLKLSHTIEKMTDDKIPEIGFSNAIETDEKLSFTNNLYEKDRVIPHKYMAFEESVCNGFLMVFNKKLLDAACIYRGDIFVSYDLWIGAICLFLNGKIHYVDELLASHRRLSNSVSRIYFWRVLKHRFNSLLHYEGREINSATVLYEVFRMSLSMEDQTYLLHVINYKKKWESKKYLLKCKYLRRKTHFETFLLKVKILLGRF